MIPVDELRPLSAACLLTIWQSCREATEDPLERTLLCNARILSQCCYREGKAAFPDETAVLTALTGREMERLLERLSAMEQPPPPENVNPAFDSNRFEALREGRP